MKAHVLVAADRTAASPELIAALADRAASSPASFDLVVPPAAPGADARAVAQARVDGALEQYAAAGLEATGRVGSDADVVVCVVEAYDRAHHDEILVSTLPVSTSRWLHIDAPARIARATGAIVRHVESRAPRTPPAATPVARRRRGVLEPLLSVGFGRPRRVSAAPASPARSRRPSGSPRDPS